MDTTHNTTSADLVPYSTRIRACNLAAGDLLLRNDDLTPTRVTRVWALPRLVSFDHVDAEGRKLYGLLDAELWVSVVDRTLC